MMLSDCSRKTLIIEINCQSKRVKMTSTNELVTAVDQEQMGASMQLIGESYWYTYLDEQVAAQNIDEAEK